MFQRKKNKMDIHTCMHMHTIQYTPFGMDLMQALTSLKLKIFSNQVIDIPVFEEMKRTAKKKLIIRILAGRKDPCINCVRKKTQIGV